MALIEFRQVNKDLNKSRILHDISFSIEQGDLFGIIGVSGAGKTTLLRTLIGFYKADGGQILFNNRDISEDLNVIKRIFGFTSQDYSFYEKLTVFENLKYFGTLYKMPKSKIIANANRILNLVELGYAKDKIAKNLSGGMQRRLDIACSLMHDPHILILDEPTTGLDPILRKHMWQLIENINKTGTTIIISSHLLSEIESYCTKIAIIDRGRILEVDTSKNLKDKYSRNEEIQLETLSGNYQGIIDRLRQQGLPIAYVTNRDMKQIIYTPEAERVLHQILTILEETGEKLVDVDVNKPSLAEVFEALTQKGSDIKNDDHLQTLKESIRNALHQGYSTGDIEKGLIEKGYTKSTVDKILGEYK
ncbi:MAG: ABC transporter ATP-binding protein [Candidatus Woesearchaeota archaeon]